MDTWEALEECVDSKLTRSIGLSNFNSTQVTEICSKAKVQPAVVQVEVHPFFNNKKFVEFTQEKGLCVTAYSPLGSGVVIGDERVIDNAKLKELGEKYEKSPAQMVTSWLMHRNIVVIPKSVKESRIKENLDVFFKIEEADLAAISAISVDLRGGWGGP